MIDADVKEMTIEMPN
jgi:hypothetical protein